MTPEYFNNEFVKRLGFFDNLISANRYWKNFFFEKQRLNLARKFKKRLSSDPLISIYTPTYNRCEILLERAVDSVLKQSFKNFEYIIIGDCCDDKTEETIKKINDKRIRFINLKVRKKRYREDGIYAVNHWYCGSAFAANEGLKRCNGEWIARIDDWANWYPNHLEDNINFIINNPDVEFVSGPSLYNGAKYDGKVADKYLKVKTEKKIIFGSINTWFHVNYLKIYNFSLNSWRKKWNRVCDTDVLERMVRNGVEFGWRDEITHYVIPRPGSKSVNFDSFLEKFKNNAEKYKFKK